MMIQAANFPDGVADITDGKSYRCLLDDFLSSHTTISAIMNTDGVNLYSSSKIELWPIFLAVNELSPAMRFSRENMIIAGIWQGKGKPPFYSYLSEFSRELNSLFTEGVDISIESVNKNVKLAVICCTLDLPAKASVLNMTQFNGTFGCISCEEPGEVVSSGKGHARSYPYRSVQEKYSSRTKCQVTRAMSEATDQKRIKGFKGYSGLVPLETINLVEGMLPDYMHCVLLGATKGLMHNWFSPTKSGKDYFVGKKLGKISQRLQNIKPPDIIERLPRDLEKNFNNLKATELQAWLLFYGIPCLMNILPDKYLSHFALLSEGVHILLGNAITTEQLQRARSLLRQFYKMYHELYPDCTCGLNIHNIGDHIVDYVERWGPLWAWSCFPFEDANAMLLQSVHGTGLVTKQVLKQRAGQLALRANQCEKMSTCKSWKITLSAGNCSIAGGMTPFCLNTSGLDRNLLKKTGIANTENLLKVQRVIKDGIRFYCQQYTRPQKRTCHIVGLSNGSIASIKYFLYSPTVNKVFSVLSYIAVGQPFQHFKMSAGNHIFCEENIINEVDIVDVDKLEETLIYIKTSPQDRAYIASTPNNLGRAIFK